MVVRSLGETQPTISFGGPEIDVSFRKNGVAVGRRDIATHLIHWYPAKMFQRIPSVFMDNVEFPPQSTVLDPFCGSGTVLLEANLRGHHAVGVDLNPLARLISRVKTTPLDPARLNNELSILMPRAMRSRSVPKPESTLDRWLSESARAGLHRVGVAISEILDSEIQDFFRLALSNVVRRVSIADPAIPPLVRLRPERAAIAGKRYQEALRRSQAVTTKSVYAAFAKVAKSNISRMSEVYELRHDFGKTRLMDPCGDAADTQLGPNSIDAIVTSPPYCGAQKYVRSLQLELILSGCSREEIIQLDRQMMGTEAVTNGACRLDELLTGDRHVDRVIREVYAVNPIRARMVAAYSSYLFEFAEECWRVLKPGGNLLVAFGRNTICGVSYAADSIFRRASQEVGFDFVATLVDPIRSRGLITKRHKTAGRIDHEFIVWLRRP